jgi:hypothetical protein
MAKARGCNILCSERCSYDQALLKHTCKVELEARIVLLSRATVSSLLRSHALFGSATTCLKFNSRELFAMKV